MQLDFHSIFVDLIPTGGLLAAAWVGLILKNATYRIELRQAKLKEELVKGQTDLSREFLSKHAENREALAVHAERDEQQLEALDQRLDRIERKLDRATNGHS